MAVKKTKKKQGGISGKPHIRRRARYILHAHIWTVSKKSVFDLLKYMVSQIELGAEGGGENDDNASLEWSLERVV